MHNTIHVTYTETFYGFFTVTGTPETRAGCLYLALLVYEASMLSFIVEGLPALEGQVEAAPVHQGHLQILPQLHNPGKQCLHADALSTYIHSNTFALCDCHTLLCQ